MRPSEIAQARLDKQSQAQAAVAASIRSIVEAEMTGRAPTKAEITLLESGALSPQDLATKVEAMTRWQSKLGNAVALLRKHNSIAPRIQEAENKIHTLTLEIEKLQQIASAERAKNPELPNFGPLLEIAQANPDLLGEFTDAKVLEAHAQRLAAELAGEEKA
jgi:hypothetical protein